MLGMKSMGGSGEIIIHGAATPEEALRYAMSLPVAATISGVDSMDVLQQNLGGGAWLSAYDVGRHAGAAGPSASSSPADGRYELFKVTKKYDGSVGRQQHHFPSSEELPA